MTSRWERERAEAGARHIGHDEIYSANGPFGARMTEKRHIKSLGHNVTRLEEPAPYKPMENSGTVGGHPPARLRWAAEGHKPSRPANENRKEH